MYHYKHLPWGWLHCEGCGGEHSKIREELEKLTSLVPDPDSMGHNSRTFSVHVLLGWPQARCSPSLGLSFRMMTKLDWMITMGPPTITFSNLSILCLYPSPPTYNGHYLGSWRFHENLLLVLAQSPLHIHPFQFKHPGWPLFWKYLWTGIIFFGVSMMALNLGLMSMGSLHPIAII